MFWKGPRFKINTFSPGAEPAPARPPHPPAKSMEFMAVATPPRRPCVAFVVFHGMGQQVPYETLSMLAECMVRGETSLGTYDAPPGVSVVQVKITDNPDDPPLARAQFSVKRNRNGQEELIDVHIYEAYWAPLTEGKISFRETIWFLFEAAFNGILSCLKGGITFRRWMFGDFQKLRIKAGTLFALLLTTLGLCIALIPVALFSYYWEEAISGPVHPTIPSLIKHHPIFSLLSLAALGLYTWALRYVVIEYVGDVAIYVSSYKVSRFEKTRIKIQETVFSVMRQVYSSRTSPHAGGETYDRVVIVGHSLGSVIAYDALNAAISWDLAEQGGHMGVVRRTHRLITFGSPLDKTAFLFRTQISGPRFLREALAAQKQPLILSYPEFRPEKSFGWVNIYSRADIISGRLAYYDIPDDPPPDCNPVVNHVDLGAWIPILAHIQYWHDETLREQLYAAID
jgi:hypothetical protein